VLTGESRLRHQSSFFNAGKVQVLGPERLYPDPDDAFIREPFWASFRAGQFDFTLVTIHSIFGDSKRERRAEALRLDDIYQLVQGADPDEQDVMILGDFNLPPDDSGFAELAALLTPLFTGEIRTTISDASLYDNIWFDPAYVREWTGERGVDRFDETAFGNDDEAASRAVSDHRPILATFRIDGDDDDGVALCCEGLYDFDVNGRVDFDDFFLFTDHFGECQGATGWDPIFDLDADGCVDFDDFFLFADSFGRSVGTS